MAASSVSDSATFQQATLPNGLRIAAEIVPAAYTAAFGYFVRSGARDETDLESGLSHFLEHMVFKGTARRTAAEVNRELDELGGQSNAYTSEEQTVYYGTVLPKYQHRKVELLTDLMRPTLLDADFQTERMVILEEIAKYEDQPPFGAFERSMESRYGLSGLGRRVLGTTESIEAMTPELMRAYFEQRYQPSNMVLAASGNVDFDALVQQATELTADWPTLPVPSKLLYPAPERSPGPLEPLSTKPVDNALAYVVRHANAPNALSDDRIAMRLLSTILGDDGSSRLFWELIDTGRAEAAATWTQEFLDSGLMFLYLSCAPEDVDSNLRLIDEVLERVRRDGVEKDELERAIRKTTAAAIMQSERPGSRLFSVGANWLTRNEYVGLDEIIARYEAVSVDSIQQLIQNYSMETITEVRS
ncbi:Insulinase (Peptidase family M16) [Roseimaritima multifibrata]|uniref:Insulinase (Peptidase family M16) n=1 Tax=Roseimaritima multifibrata TaxID=1930274 RepID=A0A517MDP5_9BACT|nr:pitrilysin family protein [Roseimaritima multifibrata]QDS93010.1 Insulinase (Peptidase family M16) [Roseimaritima multifibrata]